MRYAESSTLDTSKKLIRTSYKAACKSHLEIVALREQKPSNFPLQAPSSHILSRPVSSQKSEARPLPRRGDVAPRPGPGRPSPGALTGLPGLLGLGKPDPRSGAGFELKFARRGVPT